MNTNDPGHENSSGGTLNDVPLSNASRDSWLRRILKKIFPALYAPRHFSLNPDSRLQCLVKKKFPMGSAPLRPDDVPSDAEYDLEIFARHLGPLGRVFFSPYGRLPRREFSLAACIVLVIFSAASWGIFSLLGLPVFLMEEAHSGSFILGLLGDLVFGLSFGLYGFSLFCILMKRLHDADVRFWGMQNALALALILLPIAAYFLNPWLCLAAHPAIALLTLPWPSREL